MARFPKSEDADPLDQALPQHAKSKWKWKLKMSSDYAEPYVFNFDAAGNITAVGEVSWSGQVHYERIDFDETYALVDGYVVNIEQEHYNSNEWSIYTQNAQTGYWYETVSGYGNLDLTNLSSYLPTTTSTQTTTPTSTTQVSGTNTVIGYGDDFDGAGNDYDDGHDDSHGNDDGYGSTSRYVFTFDTAGTTVLTASEIHANGVTEADWISPNESYVVSGDYVVEIESEHGDQEWTIYQLDTAAGNYLQVAEGHGPLDLNNLGTVATGYSSTSGYVRTDIDDHFDGTEQDDDFYGEDGDDGDDYYFGGTGADRVTFTGTTATHVDLHIEGAQDTGHGFDLFKEIENLSSGAGDDHLEGDEGHNHFEGNEGADHLLGWQGNDSLYGGDGSDTLNGGDDDDYLLGGDTDADVRDVIYGGFGNDYADGGYGNDELRGDDGHDTLIGGYGADTEIGGTGDDLLTGQAWSDMLYGGDGDDFINGGFGHDRANGGAGADRFYHQGSEGHGSDWLQDYSSTEGDVLIFGGTATQDQFQLTFAETDNAGQAGVDEAFVTYRPTGQILWALVDGAAQDQINLVISGTEYDLLA